MRFVNTYEASRRIRRFLSDSRLRPRRPLLEPAPPEIHIRFSKRHLEHDGRRPARSLPPADALDASLRRTGNLDRPRTRFALRHADSLADRRRARTREIRPPRRRKRCPPRASPSALFVHPPPRPQPPHRVLA